MITDAKGNCEFVPISIESDATYNGLKEESPKWSIATV
jgi:hypothetical protein